MQCGFCENKSDNKSYCSGGKYFRAFSFEIPETDGREKRIVSWMKKLNRRIINLAEKGELPNFHSENPHMCKKYPKIIWRGKTLPNRPPQIPEIWAKRERKR